MLDRERVLAKIEPSMDTSESFVRSCLQALRSIGRSRKGVLVRGFCRFRLNAPLIYVASLLLGFDWGCPLKKMIYLRN